MRRVLSVVLFVLGGWMLMALPLVGMFDAGDDPVMPWAMAGIIIAFAAPFLLGGAWASPGRRWQELGLTLLITAGVGLLMAISMIAVAVDPGLRPFIPPDMPTINWRSPVTPVTLLLIAGLGYGLRRAR